MFNLTRPGRIPHRPRTPAFCDAIIAHRAPELSEVTYQTSGNPVTVRGWAPPEDADGIKLWMLERIEDAQLMGVYAITVHVTPAMARELVGDDKPGQSTEGPNADNRAAVESHIDKLAATMRNGHWALNGETIIIGHKGWADGEPQWFINDGQHRLKALIRSGVPGIPVLMAFGAERGTIYTVDSEAKTRSVAAQLSIMGTENATLVAGVAKLLLEYEKYGRFVGSNEAPTKAEILQEASSKDYELLEAFSRIPRHRVMTRHRRALVFCDIVFSYKAAELAEEFFEDLYSAAPKIPAVRALKALLVGPAAPKNVSDTVEIIIRHWNAWRVGAHHAFLSNYVEGGSFPLIRSK